MDTFFIIVIVLIGASFSLVIALEITRKSKNEDDCAIGLHETEHFAGSIYCKHCGKEIL